MNAMKSLLAVAVVAFSANVSAQIVYIPDFPVKKAVETVNNAEQKAPASAPANQETTVSEAKA